MIPYVHRSIKVIRWNRSCTLPTPRVQPIHNYLGYRTVSRRQSGRTATHVGLFTGLRCTVTGSAYGAGWGCFLSRPVDGRRSPSHSLSPLTLTSTQQPRSGRDESQCKGTIRGRRGEPLHAKERSEGAVVSTCMQGSDPRAIRGRDCMQGSDPRAIRGREQMAVSANHQRPSPA